MNLSDSVPIISIIIPVFNEQEIVCFCLSNLAKIREIEHAECVIVDGNNGTTLAKVKDCTFPFELILLESPPGRGIQLNRGAEAASGDILLFLHVDSKLPKGGLALVKKTLEEYEAGAFTLGIESENYIVKGINVVSTLRANLTRVPYGDQALFIRRSTFLRLGGFPDIPIMEDVALMDKLKRAGISIRILKEKVKSSDRRFQKLGALRTMFMDWNLLLKYRGGVSPNKLRESYKPQSDL